MGNFFKDAARSIGNVAQAATSNIAQGVKTITSQPLKGAAQITTGLVSAPFTGAAQVWKETGVSNLPVLNKATMLADDSGSGFGLLEGDRGKFFKDFSIASSLSGIGSSFQGLEGGGLLDYGNFFGGLMEQGGGASNPSKPLQPIIPRIQTSSGFNIMPLILVGGAVTIFLILRRK